jgi:hypothetical protein
LAESKQPSGPPLEDVLSDLAIRMERVKVLYEQYFMGIEKIEPLTARKEIQRTMLALQQEYIRNTGLRFKFNTMLQKWNIYITYWNRILREIEAGTYVRHVEKVKRAAMRDGKSVPAEVLRKNNRPPSGTFDTGAAPDKAFLDFDSGEYRVPPKPSLLGAAPAEPLESVEQSRPLEMVAEPEDDTEAWFNQPARSPAPPSQPPARPAPPTAAAPPRPRPPTPRVPGMSDDELKTLHQRYVAARKQAGEGAVSYDALVNSLAKQVPRVLQQPGVARVKFEVVVQGGKAVLKAIPLRK